MTPKRDEEYNKNWEAEIAAYDAECEAGDREFARKHIPFESSMAEGAGLTEDEVAVFDMVLRGIPLSEIAAQAEVEEGEVVGLIEIIRAKLSLSD